MFSRSSLLNKNPVKNWSGFKIRGCSRTNLCPSWNTYTVQCSPVGRNKKERDNERERKSFCIITKL